MRLEVMFYRIILLCLFICVCNGAPPKEVGTGSFNTKNWYTEEEDKFIVEELANHFDVPAPQNQTISVWNKLRESHRQKLREGTLGFNQERSTSSLRSRFWCVLMKNPPHIEVKVPDILREKLSKTNLDKGSGSGKTQAKHRKINSQETIEQDDAWDDMIEDLENDTDVDRKEGNCVRFTQEEDNFIIDELSSYRDDYIQVHSKQLWKKIAENLREKWRAKTLGFPKERSVWSLYNRFRYHLMSDGQRNKVQVPNSLKRKFIKPKLIETGTGSRPLYTLEEDDFIIEELMKPSYTSLYGSSTVESLRAEHDKRREAKIPGFENARTWRSIQARIKVLNIRGLLPKEVMVKLRRPGASSGGSSSNQGQLTDAQTAEMIEELFNNTEVGAGKSNTMYKYTNQEDKFIVEELSRLLDMPWNHNIHPVWKTLTAKHNEKRKARTHGFPQERSTASLRGHFWGVLMKNPVTAKVHVPDSLKKKMSTTNFTNLDKHTGSTKSSAQNEDIGLQETMEQQDEDDWIAELLIDPFADDMAEDNLNTTDVDKKGGYFPRFTEEEDNFIVDELSRLRDDYIKVHSKYIWKEIGDIHRRKWKAGTPGFPKERSDQSLYNRLRYHLLTNDQSKRVPLPESLKRKLTKLKFSKPEPGSKQMYTTEEDNFIIGELLKSNHNKLYGLSTVEPIRAELDKRRAAKVPGFKNARTTSSIQSRLKVLKSRGLLPNEIKMKFPSRRIGASRGESSHSNQSQLTDLKNAEMVEELVNNTEYEVDFNKYHTWAKQ